MSSFIKKSDYKKLIQDKHINQVIENDDSLLDSAERTAEETIYSFLSGIYDMSKVIYPIDEYVSGNTYQSGSTTWFGDNIYYSTGSTSGNPTGGTGWIQKDNRNQMIVTCMIDLSLYELHSRISPNNIPEVRELRKSDCMELLFGLSRGKLNANLPMKSKPASPSFWVTGQTKMNWIY